MGLHPLLVVDLGLIPTQKNRTYGWCLVQYVLPGQSAGPGAGWVRFYNMYVPPVPVQAGLSSWQMLPPNHLPVYATSAALPGAPLGAAYEIRTIFRRPGY
jgi:hypothetical protein